MSISERIKAIREEKRLKQIDVANSLNLDPSYYARLEKRDGKLSIEQLQSITKVLGVSLGELLGIEASANEKHLNLRVATLEERLAENDSLLMTASETIERLKEVYGLREKELKRQIQELVLVQHKHLVAFQAALEAIEKEYGVDLYGYEVDDPTQIQKEKWFLPVIDKYRIILLNTIGSQLLTEKSFNQTLLQCFIKSMEPFNAIETVLLNQSQMLHLMKKGVFDTDGNLLPRDEIKYPKLEVKADS